MTQTVSQAVEKRSDGIEHTVTTYKPRIAAILPQHIPADQFVGLALGAIYRDPKLREAANNNPGAFMNVLMRCAALGHQPGTEEFYLIPRKNKRNRNLLEVQGIEGYRGIVERMYRSGAVASVVVREVCANDRFEFIEGAHDRPQHTVNWFGGGRGEMIGVYAYAVLTTGAVSRVAILSRDDVMAAKANSDGSDSEYSPWNRLDGGPGHPEFRGRSMWWKTAARRLEPWVPTSAEFRREMARAAAEAQRVSQEHDLPAYTEEPDVLDGEVVDQGWPEAAKPAGE